MFKGIYSHNVKRIFLVILIILGLYFAYILSQPILINPYDDLKQEMTQKTINTLINVNNTTNHISTFNIFSNGILPTIIYILVLITEFICLKNEYKIWKNFSGNKYFKLLWFVIIMIISLIIVPFTIIQCYKVTRITIGLVFISIFIFIIIMGIFFSNTENN